MSFVNFFIVCLKNKFEGQNSEICSFLLVFKSINYRQLCCDQKGSQQLVIDSSSARGLLKIKN